MKKILLLFILYLVRSIAFAQPSIETVGNPINSISVSKYTGWTNQGVLNFTGSAEVQNTQPSNYRGASGEGNIFFSNLPGTYFEMSGFDSTFEQPDNIEIHFGMYNSIYSNQNELSLEYSTNGINYSKLNYSGYSTDSASWAEMLTSISTKLNLKNLRIRFTQTSATKQFRIDDIRLRYYYLLPIKMQKFGSAIIGNSIQLLWTATSASVQEIFSVEKSSDGINFTSLGELYAKGTGTFNYSFTDHFQLSASAYYRLKMRNEDGSYSYSNILNIEPKPTANNILKSLYPLPAKDRLNIQIQSSKIEKAEISITDISGKKLITNSVLLAAGVNNSFINVQPLSKGVYFLKVITSETTETRKIIVGQ